MAKSLTKSIAGTMSQTQSPRDDERGRLREMITDYENKLSETARLVGVVSLEINNRLAALLGQAQLLLREDLSEKPRRRAEIIEIQAKRLDEIVSRLQTVQHAPPSSDKLNMF